LTRHLRKSHQGIERFADWPPAYLPATPLVGLQNSALSEFL